MILIAVSVLVPSFNVEVLFNAFFVVIHKLSQIVHLFQQLGLIIFSFSGIVCRSIFRLVLISLCRWVLLFLELCLEDLHLFLEFIEEFLQIVVAYIYFTSWLNLVELVFV